MTRVHVGVAAEGPKSKTKEGCIPHFIHRLRPPSSWTSWKTTNQVHHPPTTNLNLCPPNCLCVTMKHLQRKRGNEQPEKFVSNNVSNVICRETRLSDLFGGFQCQQVWGTMPLQLSHVPRRPFAQAAPKFCNKNLHRQPCEVTIWRTAKHLCLMSALSSDVGPDTLQQC